MKAQWQSEKEAIKGVFEFKERLEQPRVDAEGESARRTSSSPGAALREIPNRTQFGT